MTAGQLRMLRQREGCLTDRTLNRCRLAVDIVDSINALGIPLVWESAGRERCLMRRLEERQAAVAWEEAAEKVEAGA